MENQLQNEQMAQEQQPQEQQQLLQPCQWRYPPPRLVDLPPHQKEQVQALWRNELQEVLQMTDFRNHQLPLARIKKVMKSDEEVRMISSDAPILLSKACEMLIHDLTLRAWLNVEENNRRTIQRSDISDAIWRTDIYDFLIDIVPKESNNEPTDGLTRMGFSSNVVNNNYTGFTVPAAAPAANIVNGNYIGAPSTGINIANGNYVGVPHYYPFMGPRGYEFMQGSIASNGTGNNTNIPGANGSGSMVWDNTSDIGRGLYYPPVAMMDPRFVIGQGCPTGFNVDAPSSNPTTERDDANEQI